MKWSKLGRTVAHIPMGFVAAYFTSWMFFAGWIIYELNEDMHLKDRAFIDIQGFLIGIAIAEIISYYGVIL